MMTKPEQVYAAQDRLAIALATGRGELVRGLEADHLSRQDVAVLVEILADMIDAAASNYNRYHALQTQAKIVAGAVLKNTLRELAKLTALADPRTNVGSGEATTDEVREAMEDVLSEWEEEGVFKVDAGDTFTDMRAELLHLRRAHGQAQRQARPS